MIKDPRLTVWLRLACVLFVFFVLNVALASQPIRSQTINIGNVLIQSSEMVLLGPALPVFMFTQSFGILIGFGMDLIAMAMQDNERTNRKIDRHIWIYFSLFTICDINHSPDLQSQG
jgi:ribose/xylose/arabinose/galactoside ABC-type transport system permease subunit